MILQIKAVDEGRTVNSFFKHKFPNATHCLLQKFLRKGLIKVNGKKVESSHKLDKDEEVIISDSIYNDLIKEPENKKPAKKLGKKISKEQVSSFLKNIIYKDNNIIAINKPYGLPVQMGSKMSLSVDDFLEYMKFEKEEKPKLVHRLDKNTTGVLLIARNRESSEKLSEFFKTKDSIEKIYLAFVIGVPKQKSGTINIPLLKKYESGIEKVYSDPKGKEAITEYKVAAESKKYNVALLEVKILTGRTHQIRVHLKEIGHPIVGDGKYGGKKAFIDKFSDKLHLHSYTTIIEDKIKIKADLPEHMKKATKLIGAKL